MEIFIHSTPRYRDGFIQVRIKSGAVIGRANAAADLKIGSLGCHREKCPLSLARDVPYLVQYRNRRLSRRYATRQDMMTHKLLAQYGRLAL